MLNWQVGWLVNARLLGCPWDASTCARAAGAGHLQLLRLARRLGCPWTASTCSAAARGGHADVLKWARENGCDVHGGVLEGAAAGRHLHLITSARIMLGLPRTATACIEAAGNGHLEILLLLRSLDCPWDARTLAAAARCISPVAQLATSCLVFGSRYTARAVGSHVASLSDPA